VTATKRGKPTILCIDDEEVVRTSLKEQLKREFGGEYRVETAESGEAALELLGELEDPAASVPLVIADQIMPGIKGDEVLIEIHRRLPRTLKVLLTGHASVESVGNAVNQANLYRYIAKPWARDDLNLTVREALRRYFNERLLDEQNAELRALNDALAKRAQAFFRFVPRDFLRLLGSQDHYEEVQLGASVDLEVAVMFADIRGFTTLAEAMSPNELIGFVNRYIGVIEPAISRNDGFIDHIAGDGIMSLFDRGPDRAIQAAIEMRARLEELNADRRAAGHLPVTIGIGINYGRLTLGTIGSPTRLKCGVVGDRVNLAARVEALTSVYGSCVLVTDATMAAVSDRAAYHARHVDRVVVKGRSTPVTLLQILDAEPPAVREARLRTLEVYEQACTAWYEGRLDEAASLFASVLAQDPSDPDAARFFARCEKLQREGVPPGWNGVTLLTQK
jgi:class 3 adenylate cyclase